MSTTHPRRPAGSADWQGSADHDAPCRGAGLRASAQREHRVWIRAASLVSSEQQTSQLHRVQTGKPRP